MKGLAIAAVLAAATLSVPTMVSASPYEGPHFQTTFYEFSQATKTVKKKRAKRHAVHHHKVKKHKRYVKRHIHVKRVALTPSITEPTGNNLVETARSFIGSTGQRFGRATLWCARFLNYVLERTGHRGTGSDLARSVLDKMPRTAMRVGAIAYMPRRGGSGHVGIVSGISKRGNPIIISGNHGRRVAETEYPRQRITAYLSPR